MTTSNASSINSLQGRLLPLPGNDIDTDRIIPARFLKCVVFNELGPHAFEDDRAALKEKGKTHPFDDPRYRGASILVVQKNFGCGSSREHAPQSLMRWGIKAIVGESFAEIFYGNCVSLGIPCMTAGEEVVRSLMGEGEKDPEQEWTLSVEDLELKGKNTYPLHLSPGTQKQFLEGSYNPLEGLLAHLQDVKNLEAQLPYRFGQGTVDSEQNGEN